MIVSLEAKGINAYVFRVGSRVRQTPEEGWRRYRPKSCGNNNKGEDYSLKTLGNNIVAHLVVTDHVYLFNMIYASPWRSEFPYGGVL